MAGVWCVGEWCIGVKQARRPAAGGKSAVSGGRGGAERAEEGAARVCVCAHKRARARVARVTGPGCEGAKRTAQRPGTAARAAGTAGRGERAVRKTRAVHPHTTPRGTPVPRRTAQRPAHGAPGPARSPGNPAIASLCTAAPTRLTPPAHPHTTSASGKHTHTRSALRALQPDGRAQAPAPRLTYRAHYPAASAGLQPIQRTQRSALLCSAPRSTAIPRDREGRGLSVPSAAPGDTLHVLRAHNTSLQCREGRSAALWASQTIGPDAAWAVASVPSMAVALPVASHPCIVVQADSVFLWRERFVRCDCAGRALLADVRGGVVCK